MSNISELYLDERHKVNYKIKTAQNELYSVFLSTGSAIITFHKYLKVLNGFYYYHLFLHYLDSAKRQKPFFVSDTLL